ncbi:hypothetical protein SDC9_91354 [bioreactor metagenome]|uniref:Glycosyltransferase 2-like domain-containing protein n=1 Tax=bioreactor metagenome TaxID=1076179 RepID=A0A644ZUV6_9ZZZZ
MTLTVLILAKNEEKYIRDCINSAKFADEVIVIDDYSTDRTGEIARELGAKVIQRSMNGDWGGQQTFAIEQARTEWTFFLDADERITPELAAEITEMVNKNEPCAYKVPRLNHIMGQPLRHGSWYPDYVLRLTPQKNVRVEGLVHPHFVHGYKEQKLKSDIIHYTYYTWEQYFNKFNLYTKLAAEKYSQEGKKASFAVDIALRPLFAFFKAYILKSGWRDGKIGFIMAAFHCFYTMVKYVKLYKMNLR